MKAPVVLVLLLWAAFAVALWIFTLIYLAFNIEGRQVYAVILFSKRTRGPILKLKNSPLL